MGSWKSWLEMGERIEKEGGILLPYPGQVMDEEGSVPSLFFPLITWHPFLDGEGLSDGAHGREREKQG
jgi:hypothetical protein